MPENKNAFDTPITERMPWAKASLNSDIPLRSSCAAMLQQPLHKRNIVAVVLIYLRSVPLAEAVGADIRKP